MSLFGSLNNSCPKKPVYCTEYVTNSIGEVRNNSPRAGGSPRALQVTPYTPNVSGDYIFNFSSTGIRRNNGALAIQGSVAFSVRNVTTGVVIEASGSVDSNTRLLSGAPNRTRTLSLVADNEYTITFSAGGNTRSNTSTLEIICPDPLDYLDLDCLLTAEDIIIRDSENNFEGLTVKEALDELSDAISTPPEELTDTFILGAGAANANTIVAFLPDNVSRNFVAIADGRFGFDVGGITIIDGVQTSPATSPVSIPLGATGYVYRNTAGDAVIVYQTVTIPAQTQTVKEIALYASGSVVADSTINNGYKFNSSTVVDAANIYTVNINTPHPQGDQYAISLAVASDPAGGDQAEISWFDKTETSFKVIVTLDTNDTAPDVNVRRAFDYSITYERDVIVASNEGNVGVINDGPIGGVVGGGSEGDAGILNDGPIGGVIAGGSEGA